jgi:hypothetical protein
VVATVLLSTAALVIAIVLTSSALLTTASLLLSVGANVGLSIWAFVREMRAPPAEKTHHSQ